MIDLEELSRVRRAGRRRAAQRAAAADRGLPARTWPSSRASSRRPSGYQLTPKAYRLFQGKLLERIFSNLAGLAHRPAPGARRRRRGGRAAARPSRTSSATRSPTWTSPARSSTPCSATARACPIRLKPGRHRNPPHAQHAQVRHRAC